MDRSICLDCQISIRMDRFLSRKYIPSKHLLFCKKCLKKKKICSMSKSKKIFLFENNDFKQLKHIYISNPKNKNKFFLFNEVQNLVIKKYGTLDNLEKIKNDRGRLSKEKRIKQAKGIETRKKLLIDALEMNKLEFKNHGDCYSFIKYGTPPLETVIQNELGKISIKRDRKIALGKELDKINIPLDENLPSCYNYINQVGCKTLKESIREIEIEHFFKNNSNYLKYLEQHDPQKAKMLASRELNVSTYPINIPKDDVNSKTIVSFD